MPVETELPPSYVDITSLSIQIPAYSVGFVHKSGEEERRGRRGSKKRSSGGQS